MRNSLLGLLVGLFAVHASAAETVNCLEEESQKVKVILSFTSQPQEGYSLAGPVAVKVSGVEKGETQFEANYNEGQRRDVVQYKFTNEEIFIRALGTDRKSDESDSYVSLELSARLGFNSKYFGQLALTNKDGSRRGPYSVVCSKDLSN